MALLMVFIDGFGLGADNPETNPFVTAEMPYFHNLLGAPLVAETIKNEYISPGVLINATDANLDTPGLPQSATGQTALFTGINGAKVAGRHVNGFPTMALRDILKEHSIFKVLNRSGQSTVFANTFTKEYFETVERGKWRHSVTTTAALAGGVKLLMVPNLLHGEAVYQDIINEQLRERGYEVPLIEPETAAENLVKLALKNEFTLFEYFQTDHCGHKQDFELARLLLNRLDRFLGTVAKRIVENDLTLLIVSDHGNIEDLSVRTHTRNMVPTIVMGKDISIFSGIQTIMDVYPAVLKYVFESQKSDVE